MPEGNFHNILSIQVFKYYRVTSVPHRYSAFRNLTFFLDDRKNKNIGKLATEGNPLAILFFCYKKTNLHMFRL